MSETTNIKYSKEDVKGYECVFATYCQNNIYQSDALVVKENVHLKNGDVIPRIRIVKDKKWPFWVTRKGFQNHESQKEYETLDRLQRFDSTRVKLPKAAMNALGTYSASGRLKELSRSPYLYGTDISPTSLIKDLYRKKFPDCITKSHRVAALDIETDVKWGTKEIIMNNITMKGKSYTAVTKKFVDNYPNFIEECHKRAAKLLDGELERDGIDWLIEIVDAPEDCVIKVIEKAHEWKPDFISIWNMKFDIPEMVKALERANIDPADVFSDPSVPVEFRWFNFKVGSPTRKKQDGSQMSLHHADLWHVCTTPASFYFIDSMCLYKRIRTARGNAPSYTLNYTLTANGLDPKMKIEELKKYENDGDLWHYYMQKDYRVEYTIYNLIDDKRLLDLDELTGDITRAFPALAGISDYRDFSRNPKRIADDLHFFYQERGKIYASTSDKINEDPHDAMVSNMVDWIVTLPSYMIESGTHIFVDAPEIQTLVYENLSDLDIEGTYPNEEYAFNISKETTRFEFCKIEGMSEEQKRYFSLTLTGGKSNALEIANRYMDFPTPVEFRDAYRKHKGLPEIQNTTRIIPLKDAA